jgi:small-conductance mechanosensitive channel
LLSFQWPFYLSLSLVISQQVIDLPHQLENITSRLLWFSFTFYLAKTLSNIIGHALDNYAHKRGDKEKFEDSVINIIKTIAQAAIWLIAILILLQNLGYKVTTLVGGLGVAGVAVAFGVQNILEDLFSFVSIYFDKPFTPGDFIVIGQDKGVVEQVGIKSTRIKTLRGEELVISNKELTQSRINNFKKMDYRQDFFDLRIDFSTSTDKLKQIPELVETVVSQQEGVEFLRCNFKEIGESAFIFDVGLKIKTSEYSQFRQIKQEINLGILDRFNQAEIDLSTPSQTVYVDQI